jgi:anion-transporting  ArsA/GET3 family ATPase
VGVVRSQTDWILEILGDPVRTGAVLVTTPEEMPVTEAIDLAARLASETPVHLACVVANRVLPELFSRSEELVFNELARPTALELIARELETSSEFVEDVLAAARLAVTVRRDGVAHLERLRAEIATEVPLLYLPYLFARAHGLRAVRQVAHALSEELVT